MSNTEVKAFENSPNNIRINKVLGIDNSNQNTEPTGLPKTKVIGGKTYELQPNNKYIEK